MKKIFFIILIGFSCSIQAQTVKEFPVLKGAYIGQTPPGKTPMVFAPGIISTDSTIEHGSPTFSPFGDEVLWQANSLDQERIYCMSMRRVGDKWTAPEILLYGYGPVFSPDGKRLYFNSIKEGDDPYFLEKQGKNRSEAKSLNLIARFPELKYAFNISVTHDGTLYFLANAAGLGSKNNFGIYRAQLINGVYAKPELLPSAINTPGGFLNWTPFIAPDESYLLFSSNRRSPGTDQGDIFVCFRQPDGSWTETVSLGATINSSQQERFPAVSPDGKYLFFTRWVTDDNEDVFWVSAGIIEKLKAKVIK